MNKSYKMKVIDGGITVYYPEKYEQSTNNILSVFEGKRQNIMDFFDIQKMKNFHITFWGDIDEFREYYKKCNKEECPKWVIGHISDSNINIMPTEVVHQAESHESETDEEMGLTLSHEFVHIAEVQKSGVNSKENSWFSEGLATNIGNPEDYEWVHEEYSDYIDWKKINNIQDVEKSMDDCYKYPFLMVEYMIKTKSNKQIMDYILDGKKLKEDAEEILKETKHYCKSIYEKDIKRDF